MKHKLSRCGNFEEDLKEITNQVPFSCLDRLQNQLRRLVENDLFTTVQFLSHRHHSTTPSLTDTILQYLPQQTSLQPLPQHTSFYRPFPPNRHHSTFPSPTADSILQPFPPQASFYSLNRYRHHFTAPPPQTPFYSPFFHRHNFETPLPLRTVFYSPFPQQPPFCCSQSLPHRYHSTVPYSTDIILLPLPHRTNFINHSPQTSFYNPFPTQTL